MNVVTDHSVETMGITVLQKCSHTLRSGFHPETGRNNHHCHIPLSHCHWSSPADSTAASETAWEDNKICQITVGLCLKQSPSEFVGLLIELLGCGSHMNPKPFRDSPSKLMRIQGCYRWKEISCLSKSTEIGEILLEKLK